MIGDLFARVAPYCGVQTHVVDPIDLLDDTSPSFARSVAAMLWSDVVLLLAPARRTRFNAWLIAFRERGGFTQRLNEPGRERAWMTPNGRRSLYEVGQLPAALDTLARALEHGCEDPAGARQLRALIDRSDRRVVA